MHGRYSGLQNPTWIEAHAHMDLKILYLLDRERERERERGVKDSQVQNDSIFFKQSIIPLDNLASDLLYIRAL